MIRYIIVTFVIILTFSSKGLSAEPCHIVYGIFDKYQPYEWIDKMGEPVGMNIDLLDAVTRKAGCSYKIVTYEWLEMIKKLESGEITMMSVSPTEYTDTFAIYLAHSIVMYRYIFSRSDTPYLRSLEDLKGLSIMVIEGSFSDASLTKLSEINGFTVLRYPNHQEAITRLSGGEGDVFVSTMTAAMNIISQNRDFDNIKGGVLPLMPSIYGFALNKKDTELFRILDKAMEELKESGEYFEIVKKWSTNSSPERIWIKYSLIALGIFILIFVSVLLWNKSLYMQVRKKTDYLNKEIKSRIKTEEELIISATKFQSLYRHFQMVLDTVPEIIYLLNINGEISWSNIKVDEESFDIKTIRDKITTALETRSSFEINQISDEHKTWRINAISLRDNGNGLLLVASDITENVKLRDEALIQSRLAALGEMATSVAHEINNPTGLISHNMDFIKKATSGMFDIISNKDINCKIAGMPAKLLNNELKDSESIIDESLLRIRNTINELKEYGGSGKSSRQQIDVRKCIENVVRMSGFFIKKYTAHFSVECYGDNFVTYGNPIHIEQIVLNLIQNSCFALPSRDYKIVCILENQNNDWLVISVEDNGRGMAEDVKQNACKAFYTTRRSQGGTGLGLSIASRIIREHKGSMEIISQPNKGTIVKIMLPILEA